MQRRCKSLTNNSEPLLNVKNLKMYFPVKGKGMLHAVDDVSFTVTKGETLGLVGESGCGKSTIGNVLMGLLSPNEGTIEFEGEPVRISSRKKRIDLSKKMQIVFQDPYSSINPKKTVYSILAEPFLIHKVGNKAKIRELISKVCEQTGIEGDIWMKYPHELDGGKRQTIGIARALALNPKFIICDEPVSALDVSIQAKIINLLIDLQQLLGLTYLFVSHDLSVVRHISKRVAVMYLGKIVEIAPTDMIFDNPQHPYTQALLSAVLNVDVTKNNERIVLQGDVPSPINPKPGCRFAPRCRYAQSQCTGTSPVLEEIESNHFVACHCIGRLTLSE